MRCAPVVQTSAGPKVDSGAVCTEWSDGFLLVLGVLQFDIAHTDSVVRAALCEVQAQSTAACTEYRCVHIPTEHQWPKALLRPPS